MESASEELQIIMFIMRVLFAEIDGTKPFNIFIVYPRAPHYMANSKSENIQMWSHILEVF